MQEVKTTIIVGVMVVVVILTVEDSYSTAADCEYDCDGDGCGKIIFG